MTLPMSRKHYEAIAAVIAEQPNLTDDQRLALAFSFRQILYEDNPVSFDSEKFLSACGVK